MTLAQKNTLPLPIESSPDSSQTLQREIEIALCVADPLYFLENYVWIQDAILQKAVRWEAWPYLKTLLMDFQNNREIIILKSRQIGITWLIVAYCVWWTIFHSNIRVLFLSKGQSEAEKMIGGGYQAPGKSKFIYNHLPKWMQPKILRDTQQNMDFTNGSTLEALPSTENAGRSTDATIVVRDELEYHPYAEKNFAAVGPTVDAGGQLIDTSTADGMVSLERSHFKTRYHKAKAHENNAKAIFLPWHVRPVRKQGESLEDWYQTVKRKYAPWIVQREYPSSEKEALGNISSQMFFDRKAIEDMFLDVIEPLSEVKGTDGNPINLYGNMIKVFKPPVIGERYCVFTDPSDGQADPFHMVVMKKSTGEGVCEVAGKLTADIVCQIHDQLSRFYNQAYNDFEYNSLAGGKFSETLKSLNTPNQAPRRSAEGKIQIGKWGWYTTPQLKRKMLWGLEEAIRKHQITSHLKETIMEFESMNMLEGVDLPAVPKGLHDDAILAWAGVWQISKYVYVGEAFSIASTHYKD